MCIAGFFRLFLLFIFFHITSQYKNENGSKILHKYGKEEFWDELSRTKTPPPGQNNEPLKVHIGMYLESLGNFQEKKMAFEVDLYFYMSWNDPEMKHDKEKMVLVADDKLRQKLWRPDLYLANAKTAYFHYVTVPNFNLFIRQDGTISTSSRITATVACNLNLINYPMDEQSCSIRIISYAHIASIVNVTWFSSNPISYNPEIDLPEFGITGIKSRYCDGTYRYALSESAYEIDKFSCLEGTLYLRRSLGYNMVQTYVPTSLIVIISWVSFWIDRRAVPARVSLSFTTLVSLTTLGNGLRYDLPQVSYAKAIDYWFGACMLFVFLALLEFALVNSYMRKSEKYEKLSSKYANKIEDPSLKTLSKMWNTRHRYSNPFVNAYLDEENGKLKSPDCEAATLISCPLQAKQNSSLKSLVERYVKMSQQKSHEAFKMDTTSRFLFPGVFLLFNLFYWFYYLIYQRRHHYK